jgi:hypothetical protein
MEGSQRIGRKGGGEDSVAGGLQGILLGLQSKQEVAHGITWELHAAAPCDSTKKTNDLFQIAPWPLGFF